MAGFVEALGAAAGVDATAADDGRRHRRRAALRGPLRQWAGGQHPAHSADVESLRPLYPERERFAHFSADARVIVSEPLADLPGLWQEVPAGSAIAVEKGRLDQLPFRPQKLAV